MSKAGFPSDGQGRSLLQLAVTHKAAPGVVHQIVRLHPTSLHDLDHKGRSLVQMAVAADAPPWVLHELYQACPEQVQKICILGGTWPRTKAATEIMRLMGGRDTKNSSSIRQAMLTASPAMTPPLPPPEGPEALENESPEQDEESKAPLPKEVEMSAPEESSCEYGCSIS